MYQRVNHQAYDSILDTDHLDARGFGTHTLLVRVFLEPFHMPDHGSTVIENSGRRTRVVNWGPGEWDSWAARYARTVEGAWNDKLWLVPECPRLCPLPSADLSVVVPVRCRLAIRQVTSRRHAHAYFRVYRLAPDETGFTSSCALGGRRDWHRGTLPDANLDSRDLELVDKPGGTRQAGAAHEMGHYLGLDHVAHGSAQPYGRTPGERAQLMGGGMRVTAWHAWPWLNRLEGHGSCDLNPADFTWTRTDIEPLSTRIDSCAPLRSPRGPLF